jgi:hypothetical protein
MKIKKAWKNFKHFSLHQIRFLTIKVNNSSVQPCKTCFFYLQKWSNNC